MGQFCRRELAQLIVHERQELLGGVRVALLDGGQDAGNVAHLVDDSRPEGGGQERTSDNRVCALRSSRPKRASRAQLRASVRHTDAASGAEEASVEVIEAQRRRSATDADKLALV